MFKKILIANRGEVAVRIIRACNELKIATVAIFSEEDKNSLHVRLADEAYCIGKVFPKDTYLNISGIINLAKELKCDAIHPGYGFLSENAEFAKTCESYDIKFIGPSYKIIEKLGDKAEAKITMEKCKVPIIKGSDGEIKDIEDALEIANGIGYPVIVKASAGGGGKGMRIATCDEELKNNFEKCKKEGKEYFKNDSVYIEKYLQNTRHIEIQIIGDCYGNVIHLGERDCSIQRRHQKLLEESPSIALNKELRKKIGDAAVNAAKAISYNSIGTVEFLLDEDNNFYFMEVNTRLQVEHGVTEFITGINLVKQQILIAQGRKLFISQDDVVMNGHAIECRINAEDSSNDFRPSPGKLQKYSIPAGMGIRVDSGFYEGCSISPFYDSMICKVIVWGRDRNEAIARMEGALKELQIEGVKTTLPFHKALLKNKIYRSGKYNSNLLLENKIDIN